jgi:kynurenine formamidase
MVGKHGFCLLHARRTDERLTLGRPNHRTAWVEKGGIVGRGVLLDYASFAQKRGLEISSFESKDIKLSDIKELIAEQGVTFKLGDILFLRAGFTVNYDALSAAEQKALPQRLEPRFQGVEATKEVLQWIWDSGFSAVASDLPSFERSPIASAHTEEEEMSGGGLLHQWLLAGWGLPIGEMFDLEALKGKCEELGRWTFFVSSVPLKVPGGVASPPNAVAIF